MTTIMAPTTQQKPVGTVPAPGPLNPMTNPIRTPGRFSGMTPKAPKQIGGAVGTATSFSPNRNLIGSQFSPTPSQRLQQAGGFAGQAAENYAGAPLSQFGQQLSGMIGPGQVGSFGFGGDTSQVRGSAVGQLNKMLGTMPDRGELAAQSLRLLEERSNPGFQQALRSVGQKAAALGRVGAGLTTSELGDVAMNRERMLDQARRQLATESAQQQLSDEFMKLQGAQGLTTALGGLDIGAGGLNLGYNQLGLSERGRAFDRALALDESLFNRASRKLGDLSAYEQGIRGNERLDREELRGERSYQYGLERDALGDRERQFALENQLGQQDFDQYMRMLQTGLGTNPAGAIQSGAMNRQQQAQHYLDPLGDLFSEYAKSRQRRPTQSTGPVFRPGPDYTDASTGDSF